MANWDDSRYPPRTSSRSFAPGIYVNMEFGVSFSGSDRPPHTVSMNYSSRNMQERQHHQQEEDYYMERHPTLMTPGNIYETQHQTRDQRQERQRRLGVSTREQHQRGSSAPPTITDRNEPVSPISPVSPIQHTSSFPRESLNRPLPYLPSSFRLGEENLPWSVPPWYRPPEPEFVSPTLPRANPSIRAEQETRRLEDPQRVRDLEDLHQAMMTVDTLGHDELESWTWEDGVGDMPRGPRSLGWAVRSTNHSPDTLAPPPSYVVSQYEQTIRRGRNGIRPRSSG